MVEYHCKPYTSRYLTVHEGTGVGIFARSGRLIEVVATSHEASLKVARALWGQGPSTPLRAGPRRTIHTSRSNSTTGGDSTGSSELDLALVPYRDEIARLTPERRQKLLAELKEQIAVLTATHERNRWQSAVNNQAEREQAKIMYAKQAAGQAR
jgi:hypothetical protein